MARIAFVGVGDISGIYLKNITHLFDGLEVVGVCDLVREKAEKAAREYSIPKLYENMHELFADPQVDIVLNLTRPNEHYKVTKAALEAGKHVYSEKPLAAEVGQGRELLLLAESRGLWLCGAPDTFLGAGQQGCRRLLEEGLIGRPVGAAAHMICRGHESWHPDPAFYYEAPGGGPLLDMGPYYITALVNLLGPVRSVMGMTKISFPRRGITSEPLAGTDIGVSVPTCAMALLHFRSDALATLFVTFDVFSMPGVNNIEIYGTKGNMIVPDPNNFGGEIQIKLGEANAPNAAEVPGGGRWIPIDSPYDAYGENSRALGLADMVSAMREGRSARASAAQMLHVLEVLQAVSRSSESGKEVDIEAPFAPAPRMAL
ncbi:MAG: Gfo/Idh/MocA family oxidoreductase [Oscillospiraceae bacterium]|nr:Gfo/Idh/MocA family oxidoreductase [Oscillospiraceae bacterium]